MSKVSIIIPVFCKTEESLNWLDECLASVVVQDCEIVIHDDGSPLDIAPVLSKYTVSSFTRDHNHGVAFARNRCAEHVRTELLLPLDCDDRLKPNAIQRLLNYWHGVPVYPDVAKFGNEDVPHYALLDFHCDHLLNHVGYTSVNVLHSRDQWAIAGGWDESIEFYEDGEYNARLLGTFCGVRCPEPLVEYRMHTTQRTQRYKMESAERARNLLQRIRSYKMACPSCGGKRRTASSFPTAASAPVAMSGARSIETVSVASANLPLEFEGKVLATYIGGKGKGKHYYRGLGTNHPYRLTYGDTIYAFPQDVRNPENTQHNSHLVRVVRSPAPPPAAVKKEPEPVQQPAPAEDIVTELVPERTAVRHDVARTPVEDLPEISKMSAPDILKTEFDPETARKLLKLEQDNLNRRKVVNYLQGIVKNAG